MTLETAIRIIEEDQQNKEAEAVMRGGMNICDVLPDGRRKYRWIKVLPTKTDAESSIDAALKEYQKSKQPKRIVEKLPLAEPNIIQKPKEEPELQIAKPSLIERIKIKAEAIWKEIDSLVIE